MASKKYQELWDKVLAAPGKRVGIKMRMPSESSFRTFRKAFWKIKNEDLVNREKWSARCERVGDEIYFWIIPKDITQRF